MDPVVQGTSMGKYAMAMFFLISIPVAVGMLLSALPMKTYGMSDAEHKQMLDALIAKRAGDPTVDTAAEVEARIEGND